MDSDEIQNLINNSSKTKLSVFISDKDTAKTIF